MQHRSAAHGRKRQCHGSARRTLIASRPAAQARHEALRSRLLAAATAAIESGGIASLRARALAEEAGCAVGAIYGVFPDLDALVLAVNATTLDELGTAMAGAEPDPMAELARLARAYLDYATAHRQRWRALFQYRLPPGRVLPDAFAMKLQSAFAPVERPLASLRPGADRAEVAALARTLFSAVHGVVDLGLDEKLEAMAPGELARQVEAFVRAAASGLAEG